MYLLFRAGGFYPKNRISEQKTNVFVFRAGGFYPEPRGTLKYFAEHMSLSFHLGSPFW